MGIKEYYDDDRYGTKKCTRCHQKKSLDDFYIKRASKDGHESRCIKCIKKVRALKRVRECLKCKKQFNGRTQLCFTCNKKYKLCPGCKEILKVEKFYKIHKNKGHNYSSFCMECQNSNAKRRTFHTSIGTCTICGKKTTDKNRRCDRCSKLERRHARKRRSEHLINGKCKCGRPTRVVNGRTYSDCEACYKSRRGCMNREDRHRKYNEHNKRQQRLLRLAVLDKFGGKCNICGETTYEFLALDHVNGSRGEHYKYHCYQIYARALRSKSTTKYQLLCHNHNFEKRRINNEYRKVYVKKKRTYKYKVCSACNRRRDTSKFQPRASRCNDCIKEKRNAVDEKIRLMVLKHYGPNCKCCNESNTDMLTIHHVNGGGNKHRKTLTNTIYRWLYLNNYPSGFETLCMNCNFADGIYGYCPHDIEREQKINEIEFEEAFLQC